MFYPIVIGTLLPFAEWVGAFFTVLQMEYTIGSVTFSLLDVFYAGIILSIFGFALGKIFFGLFNRR